MSAPIAQAGRTYSAKEGANLRLPDLNDRRICRILVDC